MPISLVYGYIGYYIWTNWITQPDSSLYPGYSFACFAIAFAVTVEMLTEPLFIYSQLTQHLVIRIVAEAVLLLIRSFSMLFFLVYSSYYNVNNHHNLLTVFAFGQITASSAYVLVYVAYFFANKSISLTKRNDSQLNLFSFSFTSYFQDVELLKVIVSFMLQTIVKQVLTEGEKIIMTAFDLLTFAEQGAYDLVNNLSSLAARFILAPIEESSYLMFSRLIERTSNLQQQNADNLQTARTFLVNLTKLMTYFGSIVVAFGFNYSHLALLLYAGKKFADESNMTAVTLMKAQTLYIMVIAVNGVTETFTFAAMTKDQLNFFNWILVACSAVLLLLSYLLTSYLGSIGFVLANSFNMALRVAKSLHFISGYWREKDSSFKTQRASIFHQMLPRSFIPVFTLVFSFFVMVICEKTLCCSSTLHSLLHLVIGGVLFILQLAVMYRYEGELVTYVRENIFSHQRKRE